MSQKAARGTKRTCQSCSNRFYDLNRDPITCPVCGAAFVLAAHEYRAAVAQPAAVDPEAVKAAKAVVPKEFALEGELPEGEVLPEIEGGDELPEIETSEAEITTEEDEDTFLEEEEEGDPDVSGLLDGPVEADEEEP